ncbi:MAG: nucleoside 2-deoxyribosyltransferase [Bdellovibrionota bacterium]
MAEAGSCWFTGASAIYDSNGDHVFVRSDAVGKYELSFEVALLRSQEKEKNGGYTPTSDQGKANCARKCMELNRNSGTWVVWVIEEELESYKKKYENSPNIAVCCYERVCDEPVNHSEKPYVLLEYLAQQLSKTSAYDRFFIQDQDRAWARIANDEELLQILQYLFNKKLIKTRRSDVPVSALTAFNFHNVEWQMTVDGWAHISKQNISQNTNKVFIATQFKWTEGNSQDAIDAIKNACKDCGYDANVVSQAHTDNITNKIMSEIKDSKFVVAELTYNNRGVYFESGYARGLGKPVFHLIKSDHVDGDDKEGKRIHFDIQQIMYRQWDNYEQLREMLRDWIKVTAGVYGEK